MRRRRNVMLSALALAAGSGLATACDTNDGREMQEPNPYQVFQLENTTPTTTTTTSTIAPATTPSTSMSSSTSSSSTSSSSTSSSTSSTIVDSVVDSATGSIPIAPTTESTDSIAAASSAADPALPDDTFAEALGMTNLAEAGVEFTAPWPSGAAIDVDFTCDGDDQAPLLTWTAPPEGTVEMVLAVTDESSDPVGFAHWVVVALPPEAGSAGGPEPLLVGNEAMNSFGNLGWEGPCPPDPEPHTYRFALYALDQVLELPAESLPGDVIAAVEAAATGVTSFTGIYQRT